MNLFNLFRRQGTAPVARDRLQILLAYERGSNRVNVRMDRGDKVSTLEVDIEIPNTVRMAPGGGRRKRAVPAHRSAS